MQIPITVHALLATALLLASFVLFVLSRRAVQKTSWHQSLEASLAISADGLFSTNCAFLVLDQDYGHVSWYLHWSPTASRRTLPPLSRLPRLSFSLVVARWAYNGPSRTRLQLCCALYCTIEVAAVFLLIVVLGVVLSCWLLSLEANPHLRVINFRVTTGISTPNPWLLCFQLL